MIKRGGLRGGAGSACMESGSSPVLCPTPIYICMHVGRASWKEWPVRQSVRMRMAGWEWRTMRNGVGAIMSENANIGRDGEDNRRPRGAVDAHHDGAATRSWSPHVQREPAGVEPVTVTLVR